MRTTTISELIEELSQYRDKEGNLLVKLRIIYENPYPYTSYEEIELAIDDVEGEKSLIIM